MGNRLVAAVLLAFAPLACSAPRTEPAPQPPAERTRYGDWFLTERTDRSGRSTSFAATVAYDGNGTAGVVCDGTGTPAIGFTHQRLQGVADERVRARFRFDREPESDWHTWALMPDRAGSYVSHEVLSGFLSRMGRDTLLSLRIVDPADEDTVDLEFSLLGFAEAGAALPCMRDFELVWAARNPDPSEGPELAPMTIRPQLINNRQVARALERYYPPVYRDHGIGATVNLWFFIDENGHVQEVMVNEPSRHEAFNEAAVKVAELMMFTPAYNEGEAVPAWVALDVTFEVRGW